MSSCLGSPRMVLLAQVQPLPSEARSAARHAHTGRWQTSLWDARGLSCGRFHPGWCHLSQATLRLQSCVCG